MSAMIGLNSAGELEVVGVVNNAAKMRLAASDVPQGREDVIHLTLTIANLTVANSVALIPDVSEYMEMGVNVVIAGSGGAGTIAIKGTHDAAQAVFGSDLAINNDSSITPATKLATIPTTATAGSSYSLDLHGMTSVEFYVKSVDANAVAATFHVTLRGAR